MLIYYGGTLGFPVLPEVVNRNAVSFAVIVLSAPGSEAIVELCKLNFPHTAELIGVVIEMMSCCVKNRDQAVSDHSTPADIIKRPTRCVTWRPTGDPMDRWFHLHLLLSSQSQRGQAWLQLHVAPLQDLHALE